MKKVVLKVDLYDEKARKKALKVVSGLPGVESVAVDMKDKKLTVIGDVDLAIIQKLSKHYRMEILSVGPAKEPEMKKKDGMKEEVKKEERRKEEPIKKDDPNKPTGETFLASYVIVVLDLLTSGEVLNVASRLGIQSKLQEWTKNLKNIGRILADAELKQYKDADVKKWLNKLEDLAYDMDDLIDGFVTDQVGQRPHSQYSSSTRMVSFNPFSPSIGLLHKINAICERLEEIVGKIDDLSLKKSNNIIGGIQFPSSTSSSLEENRREGKKPIGVTSPFKDEATFRDKNLVPVKRGGVVNEIVHLLPKDREKEKNKAMLEILFKGEPTLRDEVHRLYKDKKVNNNFVGGIQFPPSTYSSLTENNVYGREEEKKAILEILFKETFGDECVVPIVGMGGVGKTTLAQLLYNDEEVNSFFDLKAWACVGFSDKFDVLGVTKKILESLTKKPCQLKELDPVHVSLQEKLSGKKFLVVLDDIWNIEWDEWDSLNLPFFAGARGSKVIVTTRSAGVAKKMSRIEIRELKQLGDDHSLSLLAHHSLGRDSFEERQDLKEIGEAILRKCKGLPLAITAVGGLLRTQEHQSRWKHILRSKVWDLSGRILPALLVSYHYLPSRLKRCFAACAIIPKDCEFSKKELILLWMAMGLLRQSREEMNCLEDFGAKCFDDLLSRSFFQNSAGSESQFVMHDLIIDAAESVAGEVCCRWEDMLENTKISKRIRYSSFTDQAHDVFENFKDFNSVQRLRTFVSIGSCAYSSCLPGKVLVDLLPKFKFLRVLRLLHIEELPEYIGELKHLRHLDLSFTDIEVLPASMCTLYNLLTLSVNCCFFLRNLPVDIGNLINLRHLDNAHTAALKEMPCGISKLASLQTLSKFVVGKGSGLNLQELKDLMLRGSLSIHGLEHVMDSQDAEEASLKLKHDIDELELVWKSDDEHHHDEELEFDVLEKLKPHRNLKKLEINGYRCSKISSWVGDPSFRELSSISIINCRSCKSLPPLWELPMLKHLEIRGMFELRSIVQFYNDGDDRQFLLPPTLTGLVIEGLPNLESLSNGLQNLSSLKKLIIVNCPKLRSFPKGEVLSNLSELTIKNCPILEKRIEDEGYYQPILASIRACSIQRVESDESDED